MLYILIAVYPKPLDLQQLLFLDYASVYSGDLGGPESLHTPVPLRGSEYTTRREVIEQGLFLMSTRGFVTVILGQNGIEYCAGENAAAMLGIVSGNYAKKLRARCEWVAETLGSKSALDLQQLFMREGFRWGAEFDLPAIEIIED